MMTMTNTIRFPGAVCVLVVATLALINGTSGLGLVHQSFQSRSRNNNNVQSLASKIRIQSRYIPHARKPFQRTCSSLLLAVDASSSSSGGSGESSQQSQSSNKKNGELEIIEAEVVVENSSSPASDTPSASTPSADDTSAGTKNVAAAAANNNKKKTLQDLRAEGGPFTFNTPIGALNPFALYYGITSVVLGIPWFVGCQICRFLSMITGGRFDPKNRIPLFLSQVWGTCLMKLTRCTPTYRNLDILHKFYQENRAAMFVANHCSWMDIPFLGSTVGWRNYKIVAKKELGAVPILGTAIRAGGHIMVDRTDRRSQLNTLKQGINYLKDNINLCTFPEGTRSRTGRMMKFKNGAFKMAYKAGAPVVPLSIVNSHKVMPTGWMMAMRPAHGIAEVIIHEPIESKGKTEEELVEAVRQSMIEGLPEDQKPLSK